MSTLENLNPPFIVFDSDDLDRAYRDWGCNCGPAALAACLDVSPDEIRPHLGGFEKLRYLNVRMMRQALENFGAYYYDCAAGPPGNGLIRIQWGGSWCNPGVHPEAAARRTHWIASRHHEGRFWIFDVNGGWMIYDEWAWRIVPAILETVKGNDGTFHPTHRWEVRLP